MIIHQYQYNNNNNNKLHENDVLSGIIFDTKVAKQRFIDDSNWQINNKNILCEYSSYDYITIEDESKKFIETKSKLYNNEYITI